MLERNQTKHLSILYLVILLLLVSFLVQRCHFEGKSTQTVVIPETSASLEKRTPVEVEYDTVFSRTIEYNNKTVMVQNPVNMTMVENYIRAKDSIEQLKAFLLAVQIRKYKEEWEDDNLKLTIEAETTGSLNWVKPNYTIKEKKIEVNVKETVLAGFIGGGIKTNTSLNELSPTINLGVQNKKGSIYSLQYGLDQSVQLNYSKRIFNIKK
jgi:hypothetical protein